jgi:hypothetical protein
MDLIKNTPAEPFKITGDWTIQARKLRQRFSILNDSDVRFEPGREDMLIKHLETRLGKTREDVITILRRGQPEKMRTS